MNLLDLFQNSDASAAVDYVKARAFTKWVEAQIGSEPRIRSFPFTRPDGKTVQITEIVWTPDQRRDMIAWLDRQVAELFAKKEPGTIQMNFGDVLLPWSLKYLLPTGIAIFFAGRVSKMRFKK